VKAEEGVAVEERTQRRTRAVGGRREIRPAIYGSLFHQLPNNCFVRAVAFPSWLVIIIPLDLHLTDSILS
jgi:hypothetical protein